MPEKTPRPSTSAYTPRSAHEEASRPRNGPTRPAPHEQPWLDELDDFRVNAETRIGDESTRRDALLSATDGLHTKGELEWGQEYPGFGGTGCVSLPFIAAAKAGLLSMAQAVRLSKDARTEGGDITRILLDIFGYVGWSKTPSSRKWGHPTCKPKKGDLAVFASKKNDGEFAHVALIASPAGDIYSLEPNPGGDPAKLRKSHINTYISEEKERLMSDPEQRMTSQEADDALGCIVCPFPF